MKRHSHLPPVIGCVLLLFSAWWAAAQEPATPLGTAMLRYPNGSSTLPYSPGLSGPLFSLPTITDSLNARLEVGPLGDSHTLTFETRQVILGPETDQFVVIEEGTRRVSRLSQAPRKSIGGLLVPLSFLESVVGQELGYTFIWQPESLELTIERRQVGELSARISRLHQFRVTTVEIELSQVPRYRVARGPGSLTIELVGGFLVPPIELPEGEDPLVRDIQVSPEAVTLLLHEGAAAAEPRMQSEPVPRLIVEIFRQTSSPIRRPDLASRRSRPDGLRTIVLDPGHGGEETGAIGKSGTVEKDLALLVAERLARELRARLPVRVLLTRTEDLELDLEDRTAFANQNEADLFISLHFNSAFGASAHGAETYFLSREASDEHTARLAEIENRSGDSGSGPEADLQLILWDLAQSYHLAESERFARLVQEELNQALDLRNRGVKQAPFRVLMGANMPSVLVELGFLSNPEEEVRLRSPEYRAGLVGALVRAITRWKRLGDAQPGDLAAGEGEEPPEPSGEGEAP